LRKKDVVTRFGGDEFTIIFYNSENDPNFKENLPLKIKKRINKNLLIKEAQRKPEDISLSFAFGIAVFDKSIDLDLDATLKRADDLMYENKREMKLNK